MPDATDCASGRPPVSYCDRCDLLVGLVGLRVVAVERRPDGVLVIDVESPPGAAGCPRCGQVGISRGRKVLELVDAPMGAGPVRVRWRKHRWRCPDGACPQGVFTEQNPIVAARRSQLTARAAD